VTAVTRNLGQGALPVTKTPEEVYKAYLNRNELVSGGSVPPNWTEDGSFWFVQGAPENTVILRVDMNSGETAPMFDVAAVRAALTAATGHEPPYRGLPFDSFTPAKEGQAEFCYDDARWRFDPAAGKVQRLGEHSLAQGIGALSEAGYLKPRMWRRGNIVGGKTDVPEQLSPSGEWFAGIFDDNIMLRSTRDGLEQRLTTCGKPDCFWDIEALCWGNLPGLRGVAFRTVDPWSPDSLTLLACRRDITGVFRMPRVNWLKRFETVDYVSFHKAGAKLDRVEPVFVDVRSGRQTPVALESIEDRYIHLLAWHPEGSEALIIVYSRDYKRVDIVAAHRETGAVRMLLTESAATFVKIQHESMFYGNHEFRLLPDGRGFLWLSTRDGWNHIYRYDMNGRLIGQLTSGDWPVYEVVQIGADGLVYFSAAIDTARPYDVHVCRVPLNGGKIEQLTHEKGIHSPTFAPGGQAFLDTHSTVDRPTRTDLVKADGTPMRVLSEMDISRLKAVGYMPAEEFTVKATDGTTDLWGVMYKPFDFDPSRSYPVIEFIYGGPQSIYAQRYFAMDEIGWRFINVLWALAQLGYITVCLDARGTPSRSKDFQDVVYGNWAVNEIPDHATAIRQLCAHHSWMDAHRVGIYGHSWGGYFSTCALMQAPDTYHAAVSYEPAFDPWDINIYEPYLDLPHRNRAVYDRADLTRKAGQVKGKLMLVVGTSDTVCISQTLKMTRALIEKGIDHELVVVPQAVHCFAGVEEDYLLMKLTGWFDRHVKNRLVG
jgi:dipeptidyl-peptidase 4